MLDFSLVSATPFRNRTAFKDLAGILAVAHQNLAEAITRLSGQAVPMYPLGDGTPTDPNWRFALQQQMNGECQALIITQPTNLEDFDLSDEAEFYSFTFLLGNEMERIRIAAGL
jgi:hypothetical protein